jgi:hypothetical protein
MGQGARVAQHGNYARNGSNEAGWAYILDGSPEPKMEIPDKRLADSCEHQPLPTGVSDAVNFTHDAVIVISSDGTILFWNASAERQ